MSVADLRPTTVTPKALRELAERFGQDGRPTPQGRDSVMLTGVCLDSRRVRPGDLYAALPGAQAHGAAYTSDARRAGAVAALTDPAGARLVAELGASDPLVAGLPLVVVDDPRAVLGEVSAWVYGDPSRRLDVIGITGTNGKTTTAYLVEAGLRAAGHVTGMLGTVETRIAGESVSSVRTTPEAPDLQALFAVMVERGVTAAVMEVSSHSLELARIAGTELAVAAFTNLSQDHLDFHGSMEDYFAAKARLFDGRSRHRVVCVDDDWGRALATPGTVTVSTQGSAADWRAGSVRPGPLGVAFVLEGPGLPPTELSLGLPGTFNAANASLAVACLVQVGVDAATAVRGVASLAAVPGRVERVDAGQPFLAVVDYAHTPEAVASLLSALREVTAGRLTVVLGCGGDRDPDKRTSMGEAAARWADRVIVTDDNPRSEDPAAIRARVLSGARQAAAGRTEGVVVEEIGDRRAAVAEAVAGSGAGDTVAVAGKGHEQGQDVGGVVHPFDDRVVVREALAAAGYGPVGTGGPGSGPAGGDSGRGSRPRPEGGRG